MNRKKIAELIIALLIAAMFVSSYISLTTYGNQGSATTTVPQTVFGQASATGFITSYQTPLSITVACANSIHNNATITNMSLVLGNMENNNSISNFYNSNNNFQVAGGNITIYQVYTYFQKSPNATRFNCLNFTSPARIYLPPFLNMSIGAQKVEITLNGTQRNVSLTTSLSKGINTKVKLRIGALITSNGTVYGPMSVSMTQ